MAADLLQIAIASLAILQEIFYYSNAKNSFLTHANPKYRLPASTSRIKHDKNLTLQNCNFFG